MAGGGGGCGACRSGQRHSLCMLKLRCDIPLAATQLASLLLSVVADLKPQERPVAVDLPVYDLYLQCLLRTVLSWLLNRHFNLRYLSQLISGHDTLSYTILLLI